MCAARARTPICVLRDLHLHNQIQINVRGCSRPSRRMCARVFALPGSLKRKARARAVGHPILHVDFASACRASDIICGGLCFPRIAWIAKCVNDQPAGNDALASGATSHTHRCAASRAARGWASDSPFAVALAWDHEWQRRSPTLASMYLGTCPCDCAHTHSCSLCCRFCASFGC